MTFLSHLINGISLGSVYAIIALGYTMVYGIAKMLNFAHGDVIMVGAYISFCTTSYLGLSPLISVIFAVIVCTVLGIAIERLAYKPLRQAPSLAVLITAIGVSYFLQNAALLIWGSSPKTFSSIVGNWSIQLGFQPQDLFLHRGKLVRPALWRQAYHFRRDHRDRRRLHSHHDRADAVHHQNQNGNRHARRFRG